MKTFVVHTLLLFTVLTAVLTYPQAFRLRDSVHDDGDPLLNAWALAWVAHQLPAAPAHLFDANIFYPERRTLAYSETLLVPAIAAAPLRWAGFGPLLVYNLVFLSGFIVSGVGTAVLVRYLTGRAGAAIAAGIVFAFLPYRIDHYPHLQLQQTEFIPFALWAFHRLLDRGRLRDGVLLGALVAAEVLSCMYYGLFLLPYLAVVCGTLLVWRCVLQPRGRQQRPLDRDARRRRIAIVALAAAIALSAVVPVGRAYLGARKVVGERGREEVANGSATWRNYLGPPDANLVYGSALARFADGERRLFPGFVAVALALLALWPPYSAERVAYGLGLLLAFDLSLGFHGFTYPLLYDHVLPFRGLRIPARMGLFVGFSLAVLAGYGVARLEASIASPRGRRAVVACVSALMLVEYASKPIDLQRIPTVPPDAYGAIVRDSADGPTPTIVEFPASPIDDPTYMYYSTFTWLHLANGYSGFFPPWYGPFEEALGDLPADGGIAAIKARGARYLVVHGERLFGGRYEQLVSGLDRRHDVTLLARSPAAREGQHGQMVVYRIAY
jgi:hypothetical protein